MTGLISDETRLRDRIVDQARSLHARGLTFGASGNISATVEDGWLMTPTGSSMGTLDPSRLSRLDADGRHISGDPPTKEASLHQAMYDARPEMGAVVHLHSTYCVAVSCLADVDTKDVLPPLTPYYVMRVGALPLAPYFPPGDQRLADAVRALAATRHAILLANHGPVVAGKDLETAVYAMEELEETAKLYVMLRSCETRPLNPQQVSELKQKFG